MKYRPFLCVLLFLSILSSLVTTAFAEGTLEQKETLFCSECRKQIPLRSKFCLYCGSVIMTPENLPLGVERRTVTSGRDIEVGDTVILGSRELDGKYNGEESLEWLALAKEGSRILLISQYALSGNFFCDETSEGVSWEKCSLRTWLNGEFLEDTFSDEERTVILRTSVSTDNNPFYDTDPGNSTEDKVFLLSINEANNYFHSAKDRSCRTWIKTSWDNVYQAPDGNCEWWLRSPGFFSGYIATVGSTGAVSYHGSSCRKEGVAVRPAIWIDTGSAEWQALGTKNAERNQVFSEKISKLNLRDISELLNAPKVYKQPNAESLPIAYPKNIDVQLQLLIENSYQWRVESGVHTVLYTVTDFDHNGRIEIIYAENYSSGNYTSLRVWEVNEDFTALKDLGSGIRTNFMLHYGDSSFHEDVATPDLIPEEYSHGGMGEPVTYTNAYYLDSSGRIYYTFKNISGGMEESEEIQECLYLEDSELHIFPVAWRYRDESWNSVYYDYQGNSIGSKEFADWESVFDGYKCRPVQLWWISLSTCSFQTLRDAYEVFMGI